MPAPKRFLKTLGDAFPILQRPMTVCALISCAAVFCLYLNAGVSLSLLFLFSVLALILCVITRSRKLVIISILFLAVCASAVNELMYIDELETFDGKYVTADFVAVEDSRKGEKVTRVTAYCYNSDEIPENTKFDLYYFFKKSVKCGARFNATVKITKLNDDKYKSYKTGNSIYVNSLVKQFNKTHTDNPFYATLGKVRSYIKATIADNYRKDEAAVLIAVNTGDRSRLTDEFYSNVLSCGASHLMVVSGLHISIIIGFMFALFEKFFYNRYLKAIVSLLAIFIICALCGFTVSVVRAGSMFIFSAVSPVFLRKNDSLNSLGSAIVLLLFISPLCILNVAFWLSVLSTFAVVWISPFYFRLITGKLRFRTGIGDRFLNAIIISVTAMLFTAPVSALVFGRVSLLSPISYILLTIPVTVALVCNSLGILLSLFKWLAFIYKPLFYCTGYCAEYINFVIKELGRFDEYYVEIDIYGFLVFLTLLFALVAAMSLRRFYLRLLKANYVKEVYARGRNSGKSFKINNRKR